jgi:hypothetical protein
MDFLGGFGRESSRVRLDAIVACCVLVVWNCNLELSTGLHLLRLISSFLVLVGLISFFRKISVRCEGALFHEVEFLCDDFLLGREELQKFGIADRFVTR